MYRKFFWPLIIVVSAALIIAFIAGFITSIGISTSKSDYEVSDATIQLNETIVMNKDANNILVMGDSIGVGIGDVKNKGIGGRYAELVEQKMDLKVEVYNLSVSGAVTEDLLEVLENENNDFVENADLIILSIGGNDVNRLMRETSVTVVGDYDVVLRGYLENLKTIFEEIKRQNPSVQIAIIGLYNPYGKEVDNEKIRLLLDWNYQTQLLIAGDDQIVYVPTYDHFSKHLDQYLYIDDFHPSAEGYDFMANQLYELLNGRTSQ